MESSGDYRDYDHVILSCHADQSLNLIEKPTIQEKEILKEFTYVSITAFLHTENNLIPNKKNEWTSWNSISKKDLTQTLKIMIKIETKNL